MNLSIHINCLLIVGVSHSSVAETYSFTYVVLPHQQPYDLELVSRNQQRVEIRKQQWCAARVESEISLHSAFSR